MNTVALRGRALLPDTRLILFDKDGTLIDIHHHWVAILRRRAQILTTRLHRESDDSLQRSIESAMGVSSNGHQIKREGPVGVKPRAVVRNAVHDCLISQGLQLEDAAIEEAFAEVDAYTLQNIASFVRVLPDVVSFLEVASHAGVKLAVATTDLTSRATKALEHAGILEHFQLVIGGDKVKSHKPHPETGLFALAETGIDPKHVLMVGDHPVDVEMANRAGLGCGLGVLTGLGTEEDFSPLRCQVAHNFGELSLC